MVKIKQRGLVFFQALHEVLWQVADLKVIPGTGSSNSLVDRGKLVLPGAAHGAPGYPFRTCSLFSTGGWRTAEDRGVGCQPQWSVLVLTLPLLPAMVAVLLRFTPQPLAWLPLLLALLLLLLHNSKSIQSRDAPRYPSWNADVWSALIRSSQTRALDATEGPT